MKTKRILIVFGGLLLLGFLLVYKNANQKESNLTKQQIFEKDEYCRKTYNDSFIKNYEKKLIGSQKDERETIKLVDMFYSSTKNECIGVYDYYYFNFRNVEIDGKKADFNIFERRIAKAISADIIINSFELSATGRLDSFEEETKYNDAINELKSE